MTREEAIARIIDHKVVHKMSEPRAIYISEALDMAIKALFVEPCEDVFCHTNLKENAELVAKILDADACGEVFLDKIKMEIDERTVIRADGEFYVKNIDVKRIIDEYSGNAELDKLEKYLKENGCEYERIDKKIRMGCVNRHQIIVYKDGKRSWDAICQFGSYGYEKGLLEVMGVDLIGHDDVEGFLTAQDIIEKLEGVDK